MCASLERGAVEGSVDSREKDIHSRAALFTRMKCRPLTPLSDHGHCSLTTRVTRLAEAYWSPNYNRLIPPPMRPARAALRQSIEQAMGPGWHAAHCGRADLPRARPRVSVMQRVEGTGLRRWLNQEEVLRAVSEVTGAHTVTLMFPHSKTSAADQFAMFCGFDILLTPHSSQLAGALGAG